MMRSRFLKQGGYNREFSPPSHCGVAVTLFVFVGIAGFAQVEYKYQNDEVKAIWEEGSVDRGEIKYTIILFFHSLPFGIFSEDIDFDSEALLFLGDLLIYEVSVFNDLLSEGEILSFGRPAQTTI